MTHRACSQLIGHRDGLPAHTVSVANRLGLLNGEWRCLLKSCLLAKQGGSPFLSFHPLSRFWEEHGGWIADKPSDATHMFATALDWASIARCGILVCSLQHAHRFWFTLARIVNDCMRSLCRYDSDARLLLHDSWIVDSVTMLHEADTDDYLLKPSDAPKSKGQRCVFSWCRSRVFSNAPFRQLLSSFRLLVSSTQSISAEPFACRWCCFQ